MILLRLIAALLIMLWLNDMLLMACHCVATGRCSYSMAATGQGAMGRGVWCGVPVSYVVGNEQIDSRINLY